MSAHDDIVVVLSTAPARADGSKRGAHELAEALLRERLCACVNVVPGLVSHYWWQGALDRSDEALLVIKTTRSRVAELKDRLVSLHPYVLPEVLVLETAGGHLPYLVWVRRESSAPQDRAPEASA
jgi:periplasmic divalent cation tolerance protein